jgi:ribonuclease VapC
MVVDTSIILAIFFNEEKGAWAAEQLQLHSAELLMSTVNLAEVLILIKDRQPKQFELLKTKILESGIQFIPPSLEVAEIAAHARIKYPLNLGDCFAYALAKIESCKLLTLDNDFRKTDLEIVMVR